jgi:hypothetical protein
MCHIPPFPSGCKDTEAGLGNSCARKVSSSTCPCTLRNGLVNFIKFHLSQPFLTPVSFQGFEVFTRNNVIWSQLSSSWGYTLGPWIMIALIGILVFGWSIVRGWAMPRLMQADLYNGMAPLSGQTAKPRNTISRAIERILNTI